MPGEDITKEIDELIGSLDNSPSEESLSQETPKIEPESPKEEPVVTPPAEVPKPDEGVPSPKPEDELVTTPPITPPPVEVIEEEETVDSLKERVKLLISHIETINQGPTVPVVTPKVEKPPEVVPPVVTPVPIPAPIIPDSPIDFLGVIEIDDIIDSKEKFNALLNQVYQKAKSDVREDVAKSTLSALPRLVSTHLSEAKTVDEVVGNFYKANEDLVYVKNTVKNVAAQVHAEKPELDMSKVLDEAATRTRTLLGIKKVVKNNNSNLSNPAFVNSRNSKSKSSGVSGLQKEIEDILTH
jgi:3-methyladenine DNA glycosylase AlkC